MRVPPIFGEMDLLGGIEKGELNIGAGAHTSVMVVDFTVIRLAHCSLPPVGETFVRLVQEADAALLRFEQNNAPKFPAPRKGSHSKATALTGAG